jgi:hypothetical protein
MLWSNSYIKSKKEYHRLELPINLHQKGIIWLNSPASSRWSEGESTVVANIEKLIEDSYDQYQRSLK